MTVIGLEDNINNTVLIGADSGSCNQVSTYRARLKKVFILGEFTVGYTCSFRLGQLLRYKLKVEPQAEGKSDIEYMATTFIDAVGQCLEDGKYKKPESNEGLCCRLLVGYKGKLYLVDSDLHVNSFANGFMAIGGGEDFAMGYVAACLDTYLTASSVVTEEIVFNALNATSKYVDGVSGPFLLSRNRQGEWASDILERTMSNKESN